MALAHEPEPFNLSAIVSAELRRNPSPDPYIVADVVLGHLKQHELRDALALCLPLYVRSHMNTAAATPLTIVGGDGQVLSDTHRNTAAPSGKTKGRPHDEATANARRIGELRRSWLMQRAKGAEGYKFLGDFDVEDCVAAAEVRDVHAASNTAAANWFRQAATALKKHRKTRIADLPEGVLEPLR